MMGIVTLLLESGAVLAVALILGLYNELSSRSDAKLKITQPTYEPIHEPQTTSKPPYKDESSHQTPTINPSQHLRNVILSEAPEPFADESFSPHKFQIPTDVTAASTVLTSVGTAPVLIIPVPKKRRAARRATSKSATATRRRTSRPKRDIIGASAVSEQPNLPTQQQN